MFTLAEPGKNLFMIGFSNPHAGVFYCHAKPVETFLRGNRHINGRLALNRQTDIDSSLIRKFNGIANQVSKYSAKL